MYLRNIQKGLLKKTVISLIALLIISLFALQKDASAITVDFDSLDASGGPITGSAVTSYLASYGLTTSSLTPGSGLYVADVTSWLYVAEPSSPNVLTLWGPTAYGNSFTLNFSDTVDYFSFSTSGFIGAYSPSGNILGDWTAVAYNSLDVALGSVGEGIIASYSDIPVKTYTLDFSDEISYVTFSANAHGYAGQQMPLMDDFTFTNTVPEPSTMLLIGSGIIGLVAIRRFGVKK
ncbi:MAG: PEP-CTERM sorting domain-containing protein [Deltaproteobacteria bacterium]